MAAKLIALYKHPSDPNVFDDYYYSTHAPMAKAIEGLRHYDVSDGRIAGPGSEAYHLVATLTFDSLSAIEAALASPAGQAVAADLQNFADGGVELLMFDTRDI